MSTKINIDKELCIGCGFCADACSEGALELINGKAYVVAENLCDGLGACLPACPVGAISFSPDPSIESCSESLKTNTDLTKSKPDNQKPSLIDIHKPVSSSRRWPIQIKLIPVDSSVLKSSDNLFIGADCTAFSSPMVYKYMSEDDAILIGCPKLDSTDYSVKLSEILKKNDFKFIKVFRMEVPCCAGIVSAVEAAVLNSGKNIPIRSFTVSIPGEITESM